MNKSSFCVLVALCAFTTTAHSQTTVTPKKNGPVTAFRYRCVVPAGWEPGKTKIASFLDGIVSKEQPVFHNSHGQGLMTCSAIIDVDGKVTDAMIANYSHQRKCGLGFAREHSPSGELFAFFVNQKDKPIRAPLYQSVRTGPRHFANVYVVSGNKLFWVSFSSSDREMAKDALKVARSYKPANN
jgi:hypothetical protein